VDAASGSAAATERGDGATAATCSTLQRSGSATAVTPDTVSSGCGAEVAPDASATVGPMSERVVSVSRVIHASPEAIFDVLTDPARHAEFDGSGTVQRLRGESERLELGSKFGMDMKFRFVPYRISSTVVEYEENRLIAWAHFGKHRWRYELEPTDGGTKVTESFDWSTAISPKAIELAGYPKQHPANMEATLERLAAVVES
jgi:uncharacterized protein YndB with AHSA1/START domain